MRDSLRGLLHSALGPTPAWPLQCLIWEMVGYAPSKLQQQMHRGVVPGPHGPIRSKKKAASGGIQSGKSKWTAAEILAILPWIPGMPVYVVGPDFDLPRHEMRYLFEWLTELGWLDPNDASMPTSKTEPWIFPTQFGSRIQTYTGVLPAKIAGESPGIIAMVEAGQMSVETYHICATRAVPGEAWLLINGTYERVKEDWYPRLLDLWKDHPSKDGVGYELPSWSNPHVFPGGREDEKIKAAEADPTIPRNVFLARFAGQRAPAEGLVFHQFDPLTHERPIHIGEACADCEPWHLILPAEVSVELWVDPGHDHIGAVLAAVVHARRIYILDEICERGWRPRHFIQAAKQRWWWPWTRQARVIMDVGGKQVHGDSTWAESFRAPLADGGTGLEVYMRKVDLLEGIERVRDQLVPDERGLPRLFVGTVCTHLRRELTQGYRYLTDAQGQPIGAKPLDRNNDACKALTYGVMAHCGPLPGRERRRRVVRRVVPIWDRLREMGA